MRPPRAPLIAVLLIVATGCLGGGGPPPSDPGAEAVVENASAADADVETYRFENEMEVSASDGSRSQRLSLTMTGAVDRPNRLMRATTEFRDVQAETYVDDEKIYTECQDPWNGWDVENVSAEEWRRTDPLGRQIELLSSSPVYWAGNETVDGEAVHLVEARPSGDTLSQYADRRSGSDVVGSDVEGATLTAWIVADTGRILETTFEFEVSEGDATASATMTTEFREDGTDVNVTIPMSARTNQRELGCPGT